MEKQGFPKNEWASVTILQWSKRFDATLGLCVHLWRSITMKDCIEEEQLPKAPAKIN
jgi:hypothetical protein